MSVFSFFVFVSCALLSPSPVSLEDRVNSWTMHV